MIGPRYARPVKRIGLALLLASAFSCSNGPVDPPYTGCDPACDRWETCIRGYCIRTSEPPASCPSGTCADAATDVGNDASGG